MAKKSASQDFLDAHQYAINSVRRYERIFGKHFISTGGLESTEQITSLLNLKPGMKVLDVGCGIGGSLFYMAQTYAIEGHGIDLSKNMLGIAKDSLKSEYIPPSGKLTFELCNAEEKEFPEATFDVIYSRDAILHIYNKLSLFKKFYKWLKPGGKLLITDYNHGPVDKHSSEFKEYIKQRDYHLLTVPEYGETIRRAGFVDVQVQDKTDEFVRILKRELSDFYPQREAFIKEFTEKDYKDIVEGWETKIVRCAKGDQKWGLYFARKPCASSSSSCNSNCDNYSCNSTNNNNNSCNKNNSCSKL